jgi:hypothetical protein
MDSCTIRRYSPFLVLDLCLDVVYSIRGFDLEGDGLSSQSLYEDLHDGQEEETLDMNSHGSQATKCCFGVWEINQIDPNNTTHIDIAVPNECRVSTRC